MDIFFKRAIGAVSKMAGGCIWKEQWKTEFPCRAGEVQHVNIMVEKNIELIKTQGSNTGGNSKEQKYDFEFDRVFGHSASQAPVFGELSMNFRLVSYNFKAYKIASIEF